MHDCCGGRIFQLFSICSLICSRTCTAQVFTGSLSAPRSGSGGFGERQSTWSGQAGQKVDATAAHGLGLGTAQVQVASSGTASQFAPQVPSKPPPFAGLEEGVPSGFAGVPKGGGDAAPTQQYSGEDVLQLVAAARASTQTQKFQDAKSTLARAAQKAGSAKLSPEILSAAAHLRWRMGLQPMSDDEVQVWLASYAARGAGTEAGAASPRGMGIQQSSIPKSPLPPQEDWAEIHARRAKQPSHETADSNSDGSAAALSLGAVAGTLLVAVCIGSIIVLAGFAFGWSPKMFEMEGDSEQRGGSSESAAHIPSAERGGNQDALTSSAAAGMRQTLQFAGMPQLAEEEDAEAAGDSTDAAAKIAEEVAEAAVAADDSAEYVDSSREQDLEPELTILQEVGLPHVPETFHPSQRLLAAPVSFNTLGEKAGGFLAEVARMPLAQVREEWREEADAEVAGDIRQEMVVEQTQQDERQSMLGTTAVESHQPNFLSSTPTGSAKEVEMAAEEHDLPEPVSAPPADVQNEAEDSTPAKHTLLLDELLTDTVQETPWSHTPELGPSEGILGALDILDHTTLPLMSGLGMALPGEAVASNAPWVMSPSNHCGLPQPLEERIPTEEELAQEPNSGWNGRPTVWFAGPTGPSPTLQEAMPAVTLPQRLPDAGGLSWEPTVPTSAAKAEAVEPLQLAPSSAEAKRRSWHSAKRAAASSTTSYTATPSSSSTAAPATPGVERQKPMRIEELIESVRPDLEKGFELAQPLRFRPLGCIMRMDEGGDETFLPVEHMRPHVEASTSAIRERMRALGTRVAVRRFEEVGCVTMLSKSEVSSRSKELAQRKAAIEAGIDRLRKGYDPKKWMSGRVSTAQANGIYVGVVEGKDAFVPVSEMPDEVTRPMYDNDKGKLRKPVITAGSAVELRVIRHSWESDSFIGSMLSFEDSVAKRNAKRGPTTNKAKVQAQTAAAAAADSPFAGATPKLDPIGPAEASEPTPALQELDSKTAERLAAKGFTIVKPSVAAELNAFVKRDLAEKRAANGRGGPKMAKSADKQYIVNFTRGMNSKVIGNLTFARNVSDKEVKDGALKLALKDGHLKAETESKGVTISKNIVTVKC